jgi:hypothetical protein
MTRAARTTRLALATSALLLAGPGCGSKASATVEGAVAGTRFTASNFWWGGPYIVLTDVEGECKDVAWAEPGPTFASGDEAPVEGDLNAVLITFLDTDVVKGDYAVGQVAPVDVRFISVNDGEMDVYIAQEGSLKVDAVEDEGNAAGSVAVSFEDGSIEGDFDIEWCNNLKGD